MKTKLVPFVLAATLCLGLFAGCQSSKIGSLSEDAASASPSPSDDTSQTTKDYTPCYETYSPDEVMLTVNGIDVTWSELFYWYEFDVSNIENQTGDITDWDADCSFASGKTNREYVMENAIDTIKHYCALQSKANDMGVTLTEEDKAALQTTWQNNVNSYGNGDEAAFIEYLKKAFLTKDLFNHLSEANKLYERLLENMFGAKGEKLGTDEVVQKADEMKYVRVKHILLSTIDDTGTALPDDQIAEKKATADKVLEELQGITDKTKLEARFDELITQYGEDPGTQYYTEGYTFQSGAGTMDSTFEDAATALGEYELSDVVKTDFGYHIILRLPLKADAAVEYTSETEMTPLSYYVAQEMFSAEADNWADESKVETTKTYDELDIADVFSKATRVSAAG
ncbi:MAG: peptidylprolyl isomerase [Oscillospiraceae bacterium]|nr:peptidylprolyl isomerase [Oscillospiraceae bacterium]